MAKQYNINYKNIPTINFIKLFGKMLLGVKIIRKLLKYVGLVLHNFEYGLF